MAIPNAPDGVAARTLPDHAICGTHENYLLSCADYEELLAESAGGCQICRFPAAKMPQRKLYIDHDGRQWAVRGLLCISCNSGLRTTFVRMIPGAEQYLANAWYLRKLAEYGLSTTPEEPPVNSMVTDHRGIQWRRTDTGYWSSIASQHSGRTWPEMIQRCGPLKLRVTGTWDRRHALLPVRQSLRTRGALERGISAAIDLVAGHQWCADDQAVADEIVAALSVTCRGTV